MGKTNFAVNGLKYDLRSALTSRKQAERMIKKYTDEWVESQEKIIDIGNALDSLGYDYTYTQRLSTMFSNMVITDAKIKKKK